MIELNDKLFLALAKKAGVPTREQLKLLRATQGERTLFTVACEQGVLGPDEAKKLERWAKQVKRGDLSPLEGVTPSTQGSSAEGAAPRTPSAAKVKVAISVGSTPAQPVAPEGAEAPPPASPPSSVATASNARVPVATPSAGRVAGARRRRLRQSSASLAAVSEAAHDESTKDLPGGPVATPKKPLVARRGAASRTPSTGRERVAAGAPPSSKGLLAVAGAALVASACLGAAVAFTYRNRQVPGQVAGAKAPLDPSGPGSSSAARPAQPVAVDMGESPAARKPDAVLEDERVARALAAAAQLRHEGRDDEAVLALEAALETVQGEGAKKLVAAKNDVLAGTRAMLDQVRSLASSGKTDVARKLLATLKDHAPDALAPDVAAAERFVAAKEAAAKSGALASGAPAPSVATPGKPGPAPGPAPASKPARAIPKDPAARRADELARAATARSLVTKALMTVDVAAARAALDDAGPFAEKDAVAAIALDRKRVDSVAKILVFASAGLRAKVGRAVAVALRDGREISGTLSSVDTAKAVVATKDGDVPVTIDSLATEPLLAFALVGAIDDLETYFFGRGVVLAAIGDRKGALEALGQAPSIPEAVAFKAAVDSGDPSFAPPRPKPAGETPGTTGEKPKEPGPVVAGGPDGGDGPAKPRAKTWMDDTDGGIPWEQAYTFETPHYLVKTNVKREYAKRWARILEAIAEKYTRIFQFEGNDFRYKKNELWLYRNQEEFMSYEQQPPNVGGFYNPGDKRLHTFHGPWKGAEDATTLSILAHEAVHQFQNLVLRQMEHAPTFMIEGLSTFAEGTIVTRDGDVIVGPISEMRLKGMKRAVKAGEFVHLRELIRTAQPDFSGFHYGHTWALVHWCFFGPEAKKSQRLLEAYWDLCLQRQATAQDFEALVKQILGWDMDQLETAWKKWILELDPAKDPAIENYEKKTHKKVVSGT